MELSIKLLKSNCPEIIAVVFDKMVCSITLKYLISDALLYLSIVA